MVKFKDCEPVLSMADHGGEPKIRHLASPPYPHMAPPSLTNLDVAVSQKPPSISAVADIRQHCSEPCVYKVKKNQVANKNVTCTVDKVCNF